jgi:hypothetical protein
MPIAACQEEHAIYLAAFPPAHFKVGVTRSWRLEDRLREQGARKAAHLRTVPDGRVARQIEAELAESIPDRVRVETKIGGLHRAVDDEAWTDLLARHEPIERFSFEPCPRLSKQPVADTTLAGTVHCSIGRILVLEIGGTTYAVDLRDLVGYEISAGNPDRSRQASLGSFDWA